MTSVIPTVQGKGTAPKAKPANFEEAITAAGFGTFNILLYLFAIPSCFSSVYETTTMAYVLPAAECDFKITLNQKGLLNAMTYAGMITSAIIWGVVADSKGRRKILACGLLAHGVCTFAASLSQNTTTLLIFKFFGGFIINGPFAIMMCYLSEFHNSHMRSRVLMFVGLCFAVANLSLPGLAWVIFPQNWTFHIGSWIVYSWQIFLTTASLPSFIAGVGVLFLPESPKFLMSKGRNEEALQVFRRIYAINHRTGVYPINELVREDILEVEPVDISTIEGKAQRFPIKRAQSQVVEKPFWSSLIDDLKKMKVLFHKQYLGKSIHAYSLQFCILMGLNTLRLWLPQLFHIISDYEKNANAVSGESSNLCSMIAHGVEKNQNNTDGTGECEVHLSEDAYLNNVIVALVGILSYLIAGCLINALGNKRLMIIGLTLCGLLGSGLYWSTSSTVTLTLTSLYVNIASISTNSLVGVIVNFFPTNLRTVVLALVMMFGRSGSLIGNILFPYLLALGCVELFAYVGMIMFCGAFLCFFLPPDTHKNNLK